MLCMYIHTYNLTIYYALLPGNVHWFSFTRLTVRPAMNRSEIEVENNLAIHESPPCIHIIEVSKNRGTPKSSQIRQYWH